MKWLRLAAWVVFFLLLMRLASWSLWWLLAKTRLLAVKQAIIASNVLALGLCLLLLYLNLEKGELLDGAEVFFGLGVYFLYAMLDLLFVRRVRGTQPPPEHT